MVELTQCQRQGPWKPTSLCLLAWGLPEAEAPRPQVSSAQEARRTWEAHQACEAQEAQEAGGAPSLVSDANAGQALTPS